MGKFSEVSSTKQKTSYAHITRSYLVFEIVLFNEEAVDKPGKDVESVRCRSAESKRRYQVIEKNGKKQNFRSFEIDMVIGTPGGGVQD